MMKPMRMMTKWKYIKANLIIDYKHPQYNNTTNEKEAKTFLAGSFEFQLDEIEVFKKE